MGKTLSEQAIIDIKRMKADIRRLMVAVGMEDKTLQTGPPHYLVLTPTGGIDAVDGDGIPGEAECQISRRWGATKDVQDTSLKVKVYNHTDTAIAEGVHIVVHRDAWGDYYAGESGGGDDLIFFKAPTGGIPPRVSNLDGSAECDVYEYSDKSDTGDNATVQNWAETAICDAGNRFGWAVKVVGQTYYAALSEDCSSTGGTTGSGTGTFASGTHTSSFPDLEATTIPQSGVYTSGSHSRSTNLTPGFE